MIEDLEPEGKVEIDDEIWKATAKGHVFRKGEKVRITGHEGVTLIVEEATKPRKEDDHRGKIS